MALSSIPIPLSRVQILGNMLDSYCAKQGISRAKVGGPIISTFEAASQSDAKQIATVLQALQATDIDTIQGLALDSYGNSNGVPRLLQRTPRGSVNVTDTSFSKIEGQISPAAPAPIVGSNTVYVTRSDSWLQAPTSGNIYLGRGTAHYEGPIAYTDIIDNGTYLTFTLTTPTTQFHNQGESIIKAQGGNRNIGAGTTVSTAQGAITTAVQFSTLYSYVLPDGEVEVDGLEVVCKTPGAIGNVPAGAITQFQGSPPFSGATVTNPESISNGQDTEKDEDYRTRIKREKANPQRGNDQAIINSVLGLQDSLGETISAASIVRKVNGPSTLFIDDGTGYEETSDGVGIEVLVNSAVGGETEFQSTYHQLAKAFSVSRNTGPYQLSDGCLFGVLVGGVESIHTFNADEFLTIQSANVYEIVASINGDPTILFSARTINNGTQFVIESRAETNEDIEVATLYVGVDVNYAFQFPTSRYYTTSLYKNDRWLSKDGQLATVYSQSFGKWNVLAGAQTLVIAIDQTPEATYTFDDSDFINYSKGFNTLGKNSPTAWAAVFNNRLPGITTSVINGQLVLTSNKGNSALAQISILSGTLVDNGMFLVQTVQGQDQDYILDRATGKILLSVPLVQGDRLTLGSDSTRAFLETPRTNTFSLTDSIRLWVATDSNAIVRQSGITPGTTISTSVTAIGPTTYQVSLIVNAATNPFLNIKKDDWAIFYDYSGQTGDCPDSLKNAYKVVSVDDLGSDNYSVTIEKPEAKVPRYETALVTLNDGRIMAIGGKTQFFDISAPNLDNPGGGITGTCEIFTIGTSNDSGSWASAAPLNVPRAGHTATVLSNNKVFVVGGRGIDGSILSSTELYDPTTDTWTMGPSFDVPIVYHTATILASGRVLAIGGLTTGTYPSSNLSYEYDPTSNTWIHGSSIGSANAGRYKHAAIKLNCSLGAKDGFVMIAGGWNASLGAGPLASVQIYNTSNYSWTTVSPMPTARECFSLVQWSNASPYYVMAVGSSSRIPDQNSTYSIYDVTTNAWAADHTISQELYDADAISVIFENSRIGSLYDSGAGTWTLLMPYASTTASNPFVPLCFAWSGTDWITIVDPLSLSSVNGRARKDVWPVELGPTYGSNSSIFLFGGYAPIGPGASAYVYPYSTHELLDLSLSWNYPSDAFGAFTLGNTTGLVFIDSDNLSYAEIPSGSYLASGLVSSLNSQLEGVVASVYRTSALRLATANYQGDLLIATNSNETTLPLLSEVLVKAQEGQNGTVVSGSSAAGTPLDFAIRVIDYQKSPSVSDSITDLSLSLSELPLGTSVLMGLKAPDSTLEGLSSNWQGYRSTLATTTGLGQSGASYNSVSLGLRSASNSGLAAGKPVILASPLHIGSYDDFSVIVDKDTTTGLFNIPMARKVVPAAAADYGSTITLTETSAISLAATFGLDYSFDDFAVYMKARVQTHPDDSTKSVLWRYYRHGIDGESFALRYQYPTVANSSVSVTVTHDQDTLDLVGDPRSTININLPSGAARTGSTLKTTTRLGLACNEISGYSTGKTFNAYLIAGFTILEYSRGSVGGATKLTLTMPTGLEKLHTNPSAGLNVGDTVYFNAVNPSSTTLYSGPFQISQIDRPSGSGNFNIYVPAGVLCEANAPKIDNNGDPVAAPGTVSIDSYQKVQFSNSIVVGDLVNLTNNFTGEALKYCNSPMRVIEIDPNYQWLICSFSNLSGASPATAPTFSQLDVPTQIRIFAASSMTVSDLVSAVDTLANITNSTVPISGTILGDGTGVVSEASWDELQLQAANYPLTDGLNFVQRTIAPEVITDNIQLLLKQPINTSLVTNSDWVNEDIRLAPQTVENVVQWFNTPTITGLWSRAEIVNLVDGRIQITSLALGSDSGVEVLGGLANSSTAPVYGSMHINLPEDGYDASALITVKGSTATGFVAGRWLEINNTNQLIKSIAGFQTVTQVNTNGKISIRLPPYIQYYTVDLQIQVQKIGQYVCVSFDRTNLDAAAILSQGPTGYLVVEPTQALSGHLESVSGGNLGVYQILSAVSVGNRTQVWISNPLVIEEDSYATLGFLEFDSLVPGDTVTIESNDFGIGNKGTWTVTAVGRVNLTDVHGYSDNSFWVDISSKSLQPLEAPAPITVKPLIREGLVRKTLKQLVSVSPNQNDGSYVDLKFLNSDWVQAVGQSVGSVVRALDKLEFPLGFNSGSDSYKYNTGLLGAASTRIYGDPLDTTQGTGYVANGASVLVSGPKVKRIQVSLAVRSISQTQSVIDQIQAAVSSFINSMPMGQPIALSDIVEAAKVAGVTAVSVVSPAYPSSSDVIPVAANEKPLVLSVSKDIQVSFIGT